MDFRDWNLPPNIDTVRTNPHIAPQVLYNNGKYTSSQSIAFTRILDQENAPQAKYHRRRSEVKSVIHHGQRKLLLSEIEFLTNYTRYTKDDRVTGFVVYVGAGPGVHIPLLTQLFPNLEFHLYDTTEFHKSLNKNPRVILHKNYFDDEEACKWSEIKHTVLKDVFLISDIRTASPGIGPGQDDSQAAEMKVDEDMSSQMKWHHIIQPTKSMLKFRLPWPQPSATTHTKYLDGDVYLPVWGPQTTSEARLVPHGNSVKLWDNTKYENQMFHFNTVTRISRYHHEGPVGREGDFHDYCYDCTAEYYILNNYLAVCGGPGCCTLKELSRLCTAVCKRTLAKNIPMIFDCDCSTRQMSIYDVVV